MLRTRKSAIASALAGIMLGLHGCGGSSADSKTQQAPPPAPVTAVKALAEDIPDYRYYPAITQAVLEAQLSLIHI